jgi:acyl-CoA synthetase (AMP-forming)/AMP-acid ligase II
LRRSATIRTLGCLMDALSHITDLWPLLEARAAATPDALFALDERGRTLSFAQYREAALRYAAGLAQLGIARDVPVSWQLPTRIDALVLTAALARLGAVQNPILPILREREVSFITRQIGARWLFVPRVFRGFDFEAMAKQVERLRPGLTVHCVDGGLPEDDPASLPPAPLVTDPASAPVRWILYSSGTTADPKGARHTDHSVACPGRAMCEAQALRADDRVALVFPVTHVGGVNWLVGSLMFGFALLVVEIFDAKRTPLWLAAQRATQLGAGTVFHQAYLAAQREHGPQRLFTHVRGYPGGGAPKPPQLFWDLFRETGAAIHSGYGLTEHPIAVMGGVNDAPAKLAATEGRATPGTELRIVKLDGAEAARCEEGEVRVRGPHLFRGYVDAALDRDAFDERGFLRTGDLGVLDAEGYLAITGRLKDIIIRKGENISAKEIEDHLHAHAAVEEAAVIGLTDAERGERVCAVIAMREGASPLALAEVAAFLRERGVATYKLPEQLEVVAELPRNPSGKVLKRELQARYA